MAAKTLAAKKRKIVRRIEYKDDFKLFTSPFDVDVESAPSEVQSRFVAVGHADFWRKHILPTSDEDCGCIGCCEHCCEQLFSRMKLTKSKARAQLTDGHLNDGVAAICFICCTRHFIS